MPVIYTATARVKNWQALQKLNNETIVIRAKLVKATRCQIYRNLNDASQALLLLELPDQDDVREIREFVAGQLNTLLEVRLTDDRVWQVTDWEAIKG